MRTDEAQGYADADLLRGADARQLARAGHGRAGSLRHVALSSVSHCKRRYAGTAATAKSCRRHRRSLDLNVAGRSCIILAFLGPVDLTFDPFLIS